MSESAIVKAGQKIAWVLSIALLLLFLGALIAPMILGRQGSRIDPAKGDEATLAGELHEFHLACHRYPSNEEGLDALLTAPEPLRKLWNGPYVSKDIPLDPWGHPYVYAQKGPEHFSITSYGADGSSGGIDEDADIVDDE